MKNALFIYSATTLTTITLLLGCTMLAPAPNYYRPSVVYSDAIPDPIITDIAPPAPLYEVMGVSPTPDYFWVSGVWIWQNGHHVWRPGYWSAPRPGYTWMPHRWHQEDKHWHMDGGHWIRQ